MSGEEAPSAGSNGNDNAATAVTTPQDTRRVVLENKILLELSATLNTLTSISQVLDDIADRSDTVSNQQHLLLQELRQWKDLGGT